MTSAIEIVDLYKTYPRTWTAPPFEALRGVSLSVAEGEVFGFIGPNGAGKSTTIKILTGAMRASHGQARLFGVDAGLPEARKGLGYVPENPSLPDYLTPLEILQMGLRLHHVKLQNPQQHCMHWLARFGLDKVANKVVLGFSKGMAQRTALANAMAVQPRLLILDEPLSGLDPIGRRDVVDILSEYCRQGGTLFFTSHVLHDVERLAHRYGLIHQGQLTAVRSPAELAGEGEMVTLRSMGARAIEGMREDAPGRWYVEIPRSETWAWLERLRSADHALIEVRPVLSLESAFMQAVLKDD
jgi:ABC-2 type transport system ATP-binding protein